MAIVEKATAIGMCFAVFPLNPQKHAAIMGIECCLLVWACPGVAEKKDTIDSKADT